MAKIPGASKAAKKATTKKRGRKSKRGRKPGTKAEKAEAGGLGLNCPPHTIPAVVVPDPVKVLLL